MVNNVGFVISKEDLASGPRTKLDQALRSFCVVQFYYSEKGQRKFLT